MSSSTVTRKFADGTSREFLRPKQGRRPKPEDLKICHRMTINLDRIETKMLKEKLAITGLSQQQYVKIAISLYDISCFTKLVNS
jgi:hypothetical protein